MQCLVESLTARTTSRMSYAQKMLHQSIWSAIQKVYAHSRSSLATLPQSIHTPSIMAEWNVLRDRLHQRHHVKLTTLEHWARTKPFLDLATDLQIRYIWTPEDVFPCFGIIPKAMGTCATTGNAEDARTILLQGIEIARWNGWHLPSLPTASWEPIHERPAIEWPEFDFKKLESSFQARPYPSGMLPEEGAAEAALHAFHEAVMLDYTSAVVRDLLRPHMQTYLRSVDAVYRKAHSALLHLPPIAELEAFMRIHHTALQETAILIENLFGPMQRSAVSPLDHLQKYTHLALMQGMTPLQVHHYFMGSVQYLQEKADKVWKEWYTGQCVQRFVRPIQASVEAFTDVWRAYRKGIRPSSVGSSIFPIHDAGEAVDQKKPWTIFQERTVAVWTQQQDLIKYGPSVLHRQVFDQIADRVTTNLKHPSLVVDGTRYATEPELRAYWQRKAIETFSWTEWMEYVHTEWVVWLQTWFAMHPIYRRKAIIEPLFAEPLPQPPDRRLAAFAQQLADLVYAEHGHQGKSINTSIARARDGRMESMHTENVPMIANLDQITIP